MLPEFLVLRSSWFHLFIVEGKNEFLKNSDFIVNWGIVSEFRVINRRVWVKGVMLKRYLGVWFLMSLKKWQSFLYYRLYWQDSSLNSWYGFSLTVPSIMRLVTLRAQKSFISTCSSNYLLYLIRDMKYQKDPVCDRARFLYVFKITWLLVWIFPIVLCWHQASDLVWMTD